MPSMIVETLPAPAKPASKSTTIVAAAVTIVFSLLGAAGVVYTDADVREWTELVAMAAPMLATAISGGVAWWARRKATAPIAGGPADPAVAGAEKIRALVHGKM